MSKLRILLIGSQHLFGEGMKNLLRAGADMELIGICDLGEDIYHHIEAVRPDVVILLNMDPQSDEMLRLTSAIIEQQLETTVFCATLAEKAIRIFSSQQLPVYSITFLEVIRNLSPV